MRRATKRPRWGLFVEGSLIPDASQRDSLRDLWWYLTAQTSSVSTNDVLVYGINKGNVIARASAQRGAPSPSTKIPLDVKIATEHSHDKFDYLLVAFDAHPANKASRPNAQGRLDEGGGKACQSQEVSFVLQRFAQSQVLPTCFREDAAKLLKHYQSNPAAPRQSGRPPRGTLDLLYMDPEFEALIATDIAPLRRLFREGSKSWPKLPASDPKAALESIVKSTRSQYLPGHLRGSFRSNPHVWALEILKRTDQDHLLRHPIAARLKLLLS